MNHSFEILSVFDSSDEEAQINKTVSKDLIIDDAIATVVQLAFFTILGAPVSIFGIVSNIINIVIFIKQGAQKDYGTVNLLGLAVSDLCVCITMLHTSISFSMVVIDPPTLPMEPFSFFFLTGEWPHLMFAQITRTITAYVSFERCICVMYPFKVKSIFTPKRSTFVIISIFVCFASSFSPAFIMQQLTYGYDPIVNRSRIVLILMPNWKKVIDAMWYFNSVIFNVGSVAVVLICTLLTASRVQLSKTWRESTATDCGQGGKIDTKSAGEKTKNRIMSSSKMQKEKKLIKMIVSISVIFLFCYIPDLTMLVAYSIDKNIRTLGNYHNLAMLIYSLTLFMETLSSSINIIVYYKMSSKYKRVFREWMGLLTGDEPSN